MKIISGFCAFMLLLICLKTEAQTLVASDDFENSLTLFTATAPEFYSGNSAAGDRPANSPFAVTNTYSCGFTNGALTMVSNTVDISAYTSAFIRIRVAAFSINNIASGMDNTDNLSVDVSPDGGINYYRTLRIAGNNNAYWSFAGGTGNASTPYDGDGNYVLFMPAAGGERTTDGYSTMTITNLPQVANLRVRISMLSNFTAERWVIDNFEIRGTPVVGPLINIYPFSLSGFTSVTGNPSAEQTFQVRGSSLTNNITINAPVGFEISTTSGTGFSPSVSLTQSGGSVPNTTIYVRMNSTTPGSNTGNISNVSIGATTKTVAISGNVFAAEPTVSSAVSFSTITATSMGINFSGGNGAERIVVMRLGSAISSTPVDGTNYNANSLFGSGSSLGFSQYVVYRGPGSTVTVTGLNPNSTYHVAVFEYNDQGVVAARNYFNTAGVGNANTLVIAEGLEITAVNTLFQIDFDNSVPRVNEGAFAGVNLAPAPATGELNSNAWTINGSSGGGAAVFGGSQNTGGGISTGNVTAGTYYSFETTPGNRALGVQPTDVYMSPGSITLRLQNNTGTTINTVALAYKIFILNNEDLGTSCFITYSTDNLNYIPIPDIDTSVVLTESSPSWKAYLRSTRVTGISLTNGSNIYLRWVFDDPVILTGTRDEFALDDIRIVANPVNVFPKAAGNFENIKIFSPLQLDGNTTVANDIILSGNNIELGDYDLTVSGNVISSASGYLRTNGAGSVTINNITTARLFPVGNTTYNPVTISNGSGLNWTVRVDDGVINAQPPFDTNNAVLRTWTITPSVNPPPAGADLTFGFNDGDVLQLGPNYVNTEDVQVWHFDGTNWTAASAAITPGGTAGGIRTVTLTNWTQFSPFAISNLAGSLPVEFSLIRADEITGGIKLSWENLTESDLLHYIIERSTDGRQFISVAQVYPDRNDGSKAVYNWIDNSPHNGLNFYRIRAIETGGKNIYSKIVRLDILKNRLQFSIQPNPIFDHRAYLGFSGIESGNYLVTIVSMNGQPLFRKLISHQGGSAVLPLQLPAFIKSGFYIIQLEGKEIIHHSKIVIQ
jgi:hypothetical protein